MDEAVPATELDSALFELNLLHNSADITSIKTQAINCQVQNFLNQRANYIVPPNTPVKLPMQLNPRYISKIYSSPRRMPNRVPPMRMRPYYIPERPRTKSENADPTSSLYQETTSIVDSLSYSMMDTCDNLQQTIDFNYDKKLNRNNLTNLNINNNNNNNNNNTNANNINSSSTSVNSSNKIILKKSKSLEDIRVENVNGAASSHEMEFMSSRIQKLKVHE